MDEASPSLAPVRLPKSWTIRKPQPVLPPSVRTVKSRLASTFRAKPKRSKTRKIRASGAPPGDAASKPLAIALIDQHLAAIGIAGPDEQLRGAESKAGTAASAKAEPRRRVRRKRAPPPRKPVFAATTSSGSSAMSAASSFSRPPRVYYGFCSVPGEGREGSSRSGDCATDRVVVVDSFCGQRNQTLAMVVDGHGFAGAQVAESVAATMPDIMAACTTKVPRRKRRTRKQHKNNSGGASSSTAMQPSADSSMEMRARRLLGSAAVSTLLLSASAPVLPPRPSASSSLASLPLGTGGSLAWRQSASGVKLAPLAELSGRAAALERRACLTMRLAFSRTHGALSEADTAGSLDVSFSGASALAVVVREDMLITGHAGLCRAVVGHCVPGALAIDTATRALSTADARRVAVGPGRSGRGVTSQRTALPGEVLPVPEGEAKGWARIGADDVGTFPGFPRLPPPIRNVMIETDIEAYEAGIHHEPVSVTTTGQSAIHGRLGTASGSADSKKSEALPFDAGERVAAAPLTVDHRPDRPDEMTRVQALGSRVEYFRYDDGTLGQLPRLFADHSDGPGLPLSRGLGFCDPVASRAGVICEPEVSVRRLTRADRFVILGTDGLWTALSSAEAVAIVEQTARAVLWGGSAGATHPHVQEYASRFSDSEHITSKPSSSSMTSTHQSVSRPVLPPLADEASAITIPQASLGSETVAWGGADEGPVTGMGGGSAAACVPARGCNDATRIGQHDETTASNAAWLDADWDLAELLLPEHIRKARQTRLQRLAAAAAEALCAAAIENDRMRPDHRGRRDDITALVLWLDHAPKQQ